MRKYSRPVVTALGAIVITSIAAAGCGGSEPAAAAPAPAVAPRVDVSAVTVAVADVESVLELSGNLVPDKRVAVLPKLPGTLSRINVGLGDRVRAGQVIATLDRREIDAQVDAAEATVNVAKAGVESAEAGLANALLEHERSTNLFGRGALPRQRLDAAETARRASAAQRDLARASLAQSEAALRRAQELRRDATITSPINGVIVEHNYDAGSLVSPGEMPIVVVADLSVMKLEAGVSELEAGRLQAGMPARVSVQAKPGEIFEGRVAAIAPEVDARNRHFRIEVRVPNPRMALLSGMYGSAAIPLERAPQVVAVPREAVTTRDGKRVVLKVSGETVQPVAVTEGVTDGRVVQIATGLQPGDVIVSDARQSVADGARVNPVFAR